MDCAESLELLSEYQENRLDEGLQANVSEHLRICQPCAGVFEDLQVIVESAGLLHTEEGISFPDENAVWQRIRLTRREVH